MSLTPATPTSVNLVPSALSRSDAEATVAGVAQSVPTQMTGMSLSPLVPAQPAPTASPSSAVVVEQQVPMKEWFVPHDLGRREVSVTVYDELGQMMIGEVLVIDENSVQVKFKRAHGGSVVIR